MLRCVGCGGLVSEWAARCPLCGHDTGDAFDIRPVAAVTRPAEPRVRGANRLTPDRIQRAITVAVALLMLSSFGGVVSHAVGSGHRPSRAAGVDAPRLAGRVIAEADDGTLYVSDPDGTHSTLLRPRLSSLARPLLVDQDGTVISVTSPSTTDLSANTGALPVTLNGRSTIVDPDPFTNGGRWLTEITGSKWHGVTSIVSLVTLAGTREATLGTADDAAGDPANPGAFVSVPAARQPAPVIPEGGYVGLSDARIELRDVGRPWATLATAAQLDRDAGQPLSQAVNLAVFPDGDGQKVAVMVSPIGSEVTNSALVVLDRRGALLGAVRADHGPSEYSPIYWSPDDSSIAYETFGTVGTSLAVVGPSFQVAIQSLQPTTSIDGCSWAPDSSWLVCRATSAYTDNWLLAPNDPTLTPRYSVPARNRPVAWLPGVA